MANLFVTNCFRVGHISRYCNSRQPQQSPSSFRQPFRSQNQPNFQGDNFRNQPHTQQPNFRNNGYQNNQNSQRFQNRLPHSYLPRGQSNQFPAQRQPFDNQRAQYNLNGMGSSTWGNWRPKRSQNLPPRRSTEMRLSMIGYPKENVVTKKEKCSNRWTV